MNYTNSLNVFPKVPVNIPIHYKYVDIFFNLSGYGDPCQGIISPGDRDGENCSVQTFAGMGTEILFASRGWDGDQFLHEEFSVVISSQD